MSSSDSVLERKMLLERCFSAIKLFDIGRDLNIKYFLELPSKWKMDGDAAAYELASNIDDQKLKQIFEQYNPRNWVVFRGQRYTYENGKLCTQSSWGPIQVNIRRLKEKFGRECIALLRFLIESGRESNLGEIRGVFKSKGFKTDPVLIINELEHLGILIPFYRSESYLEWKVPEEIIPLVRFEIFESSAAGKTVSKVETFGKLPRTEASASSKSVDYVQLESERLMKMDKELYDYLAGLLQNRLERTIEFGKKVSSSFLAEYLTNLFGSVLYTDSFLALAQQYGLANTEIVHSKGKTGMRTGFNLALFGEPGTGKSFATRDMILGKSDANIPPHGIPGRNRYAGGITPARFIRIGQAYSDRVFNFVVPEFNDWFKYKGMVEPLKLAMERGEVKYELHREVIGPYRFNSFFSVNYNTAVYGRGYEITIKDPNFQAIEDRMLCRLHRLTKARYIEIAQSQMKLALGEISVGAKSRLIRDHLTLVYAIETGHPLVAKLFPYKPVMLSQKIYKMLEEARKAILDRISSNSLRFSTRLEDRAIRLACALSLIRYFQSEGDYIPLGDEETSYAMKTYVEEASVRSLEEFDANDVLKALSIL